MSKTQLTLGSLFSGSGGFELAGVLAGMKPIWNSDIEPFAIRVTTKRLPDTKHYGDVSTLNGAELEPVDVITFGSPCQDMSIAGRRAGLDGERSGLFHQAVRIIREMREATNGEKPRFIVWENVPGAFTSNGGNDFKAVLEAVIGIAQEDAPEVPAPEQGRWPAADIYVGDGWSVAYRVLDAQFWGVPQRRKRIFLVADFAGGRAPEILFDSEGVSGYSPESFRAWQRAANGAEAGVGAAGEGRYVINPQGSSGITITEDVTATLVAQDHGHHPAVLDEPVQAAGFLTESGESARSIGYQEECSPTLRAGMVPGLLFEAHGRDARYNGPLDVAPTMSRYQGTGSGNVPLVAHEDVTVQPFGIGSYHSKGMLSDNPHAGIYEAETARTLDGSGGSPVPNQGGIAIVETYAMTTGSYMQVDREVSPPLMARDYKDPNVVSEIEHLPASYRVRRLTPTECARLQGFADRWCADLGTEEPTQDDIAFWAGVFETWRKATNPEGQPKTEKQIIRWLRDPYTDGAEYRLWGNGVALPCVYFVLAGIAWAAEL